LSIGVVTYPFILLNLKTYEQSMGSKAIEFARVAERVYDKTGISIAIAPQALDVQALVDASETPYSASTSTLFTQENIRGISYPRQ